MSKSLRLFLPAVCAVCVASPVWAIQIGSSSQVAKERERQATPVLQVAPGKFQIAIREGEFQEVKLTVSNAGGQVLRWSAQSLESWIEPKTRSGELSYQGEQEVTLILRAPAGVAAGKTTSGLLRIEAPGAQGSPAVIPIAVQIQVTEAAAPTEATPTTESTEPTQAEPQAKPEADEAGQPEVAPSASPWMMPSDASDGRDETPWEPKERLGFGLRLGIGIPGGGDESFGAAISPGLFYRRFQVEGSWGLEAGLEFGSSSSDKIDGVETKLSTVSGLLLYSLNKKRTLYVLGGAELWQESIVDPFGDGESNLGLGLRLGTGYTLTRYPIDLRLGFSLLLGSENVSSVLGLAVGYLF